MKKIMAILSLLLILGCSSKELKENKTDLIAHETYKFEYSSPEKEGINSKYLIEMLNKIDQKNPKIHSIIIMKNNKIVLEAYTAPYTKNDQHHINSVTKSITSALIGIAIDKGYIDSVEDKISKYFPNLYKDEKADITIADLMTMSSGFEIGDDDINFGEFFYGKGKMIEYMASQRLISKPGTVFKYNTGDVHLLSAILTKATGMSTKDFADKYLFEPLKIYDYNWSKQLDGYYFGGHSISMKPIDMLKFGMLYMNNGIFDGKEIISKEWVDLSTKGHINTTNPYIRSAKEYGYLWWIYPENAYTANGYMGQNIINVPKDNLTVVFTASDFNKPFRLFEKYIQPSINDTALDENIENMNKLNDLLNKLQYSEKELLNEIPKNWQAISGKKFKFEKDNPLGIKEVKIEFKDKTKASLDLKVSWNSKKYKINLGLENRYRRNILDDFNPSYLKEDIIGAKAYWKKDKLYLKLIQIGNESFEKTYVCKLKNNQLIIKDSEQYKVIKSR